MNDFAIQNKPSHYWLQLKDLVSRLTSTLASKTRRLRNVSNNAQSVVVNHERLAHHCSTMNSNTARHILTLYVKGYDTRHICSTLGTSRRTIVRVVTIAIINLRTKN